ncbi:MAG: right-handed parallel beta-helix repeat-containing protein [Clostridia bacterium]|nr:right-handed parallel beta-helix repeat-containing protein [Clostridia bacterium]
MEIKLYVDASAKGVGTGAPDAPFSSLALAWETAKSYLALPGKTDVTLSLAKGRYLLRDTLTFNGKAFNAASTLTVEGDGAVISAAVPFDAHLFEKVGENLYKVNLSGMGAFRNLLVDGKLATLAHMGGKYVDEPDSHSMRFDRTFDAKDPTRDARTLNKLYLAEDLVRPLVGDKTEGRVAVRCAFHCEYEWDYNIMHIVSVDLDDVAIYEEDGVKETHVACYFDPEEYRHFQVPAYSEANLDGTGGGYHLKTRLHFLSDNKAFVRKENDYYYDAENETLYYYTEGDVLAHTFACAKLDYLFRCEDLRGVTFRGITFTGTDYLALREGYHAGEQASASNVVDGEFPKEAAVYSKNAYGVTFAGCRFVELGCEGVSFGGRVEDLTVKNCHFENLGSAAIRCGEPHLRRYDAKNGNARVLIENNFITRASRELWASPAVMMSACCDVTITRNTVCDVPYTGISVGWCWAPNLRPYGEEINLTGVMISHNYVYDYMTGLADGGAIYTLGGNAPRDDHNHYNRTLGNVVVLTKHTGNARGVCLMGMYHDGSSSNWHSKNNVVVAQSAGAHPDEENPGYDARFLHTLRERRRRTCYFFSQNTAEGANAYNILHDECYFIRCRETDPEKRQIEAAWMCMVPARWVYNENMQYVYTWDALPEGAVQIMNAAGCDGHHPDLDWLKTDRY